MIGNPKFTRVLLSCGILSSLMYIGMNIFVPRGYKGYNSATQTVSELSALNSPTRTVWVSLAFVYVLLFAAFGAGVSQTAKGNRWLRKVAMLIFVYAIVNFYWPPMHLRGNEPTLTDTLHIIWAMITILLMMLIMFFGSASFGKSFRVYTLFTFIVFIIFGILIAFEAPGIARNLPTPHIGIWERINIGSYMIWIMVLAMLLLHREEKLQGSGNLTNAVK